jgi:hypothetical protein
MKDHPTLSELQIKCSQQTDVPKPAPCSHCTMGQFGLRLLVILQVRQLRTRSFRRDTWDLLQDPW